MDRGYRRLVKRVSIVGSTGSGKTRFGRELASLMSVPFTELDAINWGPNWTMIGAERFQALAAEAIAQDVWVIDGNYGGRGIRDLVWARADAIIWLDYSLPLVLWRLLRRGVVRIRSREELWPGTGNRETIRDTFFSRESLFIWAVTSYGKRRKNYPRLLALPQYESATKLRFPAPREAEQWLEAQRRGALSRIHG